MTPDHLWQSPSKTKKRRRPRASINVDIAQKDEGLKPAFPGFRLRPSCGRAHAGPTQTCALPQPRQTTGRAVPLPCHAERRRATIETTAIRFQICTHIYSNYIVIYSDNNTRLITTSTR